MFTNHQLQDFKTKINAAHTIALFWHNNIDWDAVGSVLWLAWILEKLNKNVSCFTSTTPSSYFNFVQWIEKIRTDFDYGQYDLIIFLDFTWYGRIKKITEWYEAYFDSANIIVVDHHIDDPDSLVTHALKLKDPDASSNCELLLEICHVLWPHLIDSTIATHRYMGLLTDTWSFQYQLDSKRTFANASQLITYWANKDMLVQYLFHHASKWLLEFVKLVTPRIIFDRYLCYIWYSHIELEALGITPDQAEAFMIFVRSVHGISVFVECKIELDRIRFSLRSWYTESQRIDVQKLAQSLGGGWHMYAAWCQITRNPDIALDEQIHTIMSRLNLEITKQL